MKDAQTFGRFEFTEEELRASAADPRIHAEYEEAMAAIELQCVEAEMAALERYTHLFVDQFGRPLRP